MKLYYSPGACSLAPHIVLREAGLDFELVLASTKSHKLQDGTDYYTINPKGYVPLLELDDSERLTETPAIVQYLAAQAPGKNLVPALGTMAHYRLLEWLNFISTEVHKSIGTIFNPAMPEEAKELMRARAKKRLDWIDGELAGKEYLLGERFSVADAYLFTVVRWTPFTAIDVSDLANLNACMARVGARPHVHEALVAEGLVK